MNEANTTPDLEECFTQPEGWRWGSFERDIDDGTKRKIRFGTVSPQDSTPDAIVVCLQGLREFSEKYYEIARWCNDNNFAFWAFDWAGQGKSTRYLPSNQQKRHGKEFDYDINDLHHLITEHISPSSNTAENKQIPMAMIAHSMGANLGLRYLQKHPDIFDCAAFSSPLIGIKVFRYIPQNLALAATYVCKITAGKSYIPGGGDWGKEISKARLSSDKVRGAVQGKWCEADADLRTGSITFGWLYEAQKSCMEIQKPIIHTKITTPCLFGIAGNDDLVDNRMAMRITSGISEAKTINYPESFHEILMERDYIRGDFLKNFYDLIKEIIISSP